MAIESSTRLRTSVNIHGLSHMTLPVHDRFAAARFYTTIFNCEIDHEIPLDRVRPGSGNIEVTVELCDGIEVGLFEQDHGQPGPEQGHPHHAFEVRAEDVPAWIEQLEYWGVPFFGPRAHGATTCSIYFNDPDGNHLELHCTDYPEELTGQLPRGHQVAAGEPSHAPANDSWPPPHRAEEAERQFQAKLAAMRAHPHQQERRNRQ